MFLPLAFSLALDSAAPSVPPPARYQYEGFIDGKTVGNNSLTLKRGPDEYIVDEKADAHLPTGDQSAATHMTLDNQLRPTDYSATYTVFDEPAKATVSFSDRVATMVMGSDTKTIPMGGSSRSFIVLDTSLVSGYFLLPAQVRAFAGADLTAIIPGQGGSAFLNVIPNDRPARPSDVPAGDVSISFAGEIPFVEWYEPSTLILDELSMPVQNLVVKRRR
ncbi:MAG: hypothetical protein DLM50_09255 [Candidatus Meridianibacter frigidus]|nr:MAG: hypothetical protein DLM50_09255 [Candidatus Eremiobacteraeota bacterium]